MLTVWPMIDRPDGKVAKDASQCTDSAIFGPPRMSGTSYVFHMNSIIRTRMVMSHCLGLEILFAFCMVDFYGK